MEKITNISLKHNRAKTILMVKDFLCLGTKEAVEYVNSVLETREIIIKPHNFHLSYLEIFNGDYIDESEKYDYYKIEKMSLKGDMHRVWFNENGSLKEVANGSRDEDKLRAIYKAVIDFIRWYNEKGD